jgi:hypothetical protein
MSWNKVSFSEMGNSWPSQNCQPTGGKLPANILISPTYGWAMWLPSPYKEVIVGIYCFED